MKHPKQDTAAHTPGPWTLDAGGWPLIINGPEPWAEGTIDDGAQADVVVLIDCLENSGRTYDYPEEIAEANARLIAAAPELLAALEDVVRVYARIGPDSVLAPARAAIARARGQEAPR
jgi:hypothetical protein